MNASDKEIISALLKIAGFCGTFPTEKKSQRFYIYQCLTFICNLCYTIFGIYNNSSIYETDKINAFVGCIISFLVAAQGLSFQLVCLCSAKRLRKFYLNLQTHYDGAPTKRRSVFLVLLLLCVTVCVRAFLVLWIWIPDIGIQTTFSYSFRHLNDCYTMVSVLLLVHINIVVKKRFLLINSFLKHSHCVRYTQRIYGKTTQLISDFSSIFGYQILIVIANSVCALLENLHVVLWYFDYSRDDYLKLFCWYGFYSITLIVTNSKY